MRHDLSPVSSAVERAARALCRHERVDPDARAEPGAAPAWRRRVAIVRVVLEAAAKPPLPRVFGEPTPEQLRAENAWYREWLDIGGAGAQAMDPKARRLERGRIRTAWRAWNGMIDAMLEGLDAPVASEPVLARRGGGAEGDLRDHAPAGPARQLDGDVDHGAYVGDDLRTT
jgi:hypothetical protein